jgi:hypothetical protein
MFLSSVHSITHPGRSYLYISPICPSGGGDVSEIQHLFFYDQSGCQFMLNSKQKVQECDATKVEQGNLVGNIIILVKNIIKKNRCTT